MAELSSRVGAWLKLLLPGCAAAMRREREVGGAPPSHSPARLRVGAVAPAHPHNANWRQHVARALTHFAGTFK